MTCAAPARRETGQARRGFVAAAASMASGRSISPFQFLSDQTRQFGVEARIAQDFISLVQLCLGQTTQPTDALRNIAARQLEIAGLTGSSVMDVGQHDDLPQDDVEVTRSKLAPA